MSTGLERAHEAMRLRRESGIKVDRESLRSYSSEALLGILRANPDVFDFVARMAAVKARKVGS